jgi:hypothetical protein
MDRPHGCAGLSAEEEETMTSPVTMISMAELTVRIIEAVGDIQRMPGETPEQFLANAKDEPDGTTMVEISRRAAQAAIDYLNECVKSSAGGLN